MPSSRYTPVPQAGQRTVSGCSATGSGSRLTANLPSSLILVVVLKFKAAVGTDLGVSGQVLATFRAGEGKLCTAFRAGIIFIAQRAATVGAEVHTTGGTFLVLLADRLPTFPAHDRPFYLRAGLILRTFRLLKVVATMGANIGVRWQVLATFGAGEGELCPTSGAGLILIIERATAIGAQVYAARGTLLILGANGFATLSAKGCPLS